MSSPPTPRRGGHGLPNALLSGQLADRPIGQILLALAATLAALPLILQLLTWSLERPYAFYINANSETLRLTIQENAAASWFIANALIRERAETLPDPTAPIILHDSQTELQKTQATPSQPFRGCLEIGPHAEVTLHRQGSGALMVSVEGLPIERRQATPAVILRPLITPAHGTADTQCAHSHAQGMQTLQRITLEATIGEQPLNGTLRGRGRIGGDPYFSTLAQSPPLLRGGEVIAMGRRLFSERAYTLMEAPLHLGDTLSVLDSPKPEDESALVTCLFSVAGGETELGGIELSCHANGQALSILRYGDRSRDSLAPRPWDVLINEPSMQVVLPLAITGLFVFALRLLDGCYPGLCRRLGRARKGSMGNKSEEREEDDRGNETEKGG
ncbi:hypothetical protein [Halomonas marinisediminis]|uniref:Uncharacterized protein n=1 Tax=Halomonas marinisediminis TaxID=2546095 RepID=A0ABY2D375_9GAMM|nr:hypothetical protein [Halomonas marinisediminis]TDA95488.1 hypothetical protein E0702_15400 [Halomonas marinisediminis]